MPSLSKRRKTSAIPEISFDPTSRSEYLTGFRKRKQARIKASQEKAAERARQEKIQERAETRKRRREEVEEHVRAVNEASGLLNGHGEDLDAEIAEDGENGEWEGFEEPVPVINRQDEYIDEEKFTTVTVEAVTVSRGGFESMNGRESESDEEMEGQDKPGPKGNDRSQQRKSLENGTTKKKKSKTATDVKKKRKKSFKYESKDERKLARAKQKAKNSMQAKMRKEISSVRSQR